MKKNKYQLIDEGSYYRAFKQWLDASMDIYNPKDEYQMNEKWLKFADDVGIYLATTKVEEKILAEIIDSICWKEAKKYYSITSYETNVETEEMSVR